MSDYRERKVCPVCGCPSIMRRTRKGGYYCRKCDDFFDQPEVRMVKNGANMSNAFEGHKASA